VIGISEKARRLRNAVEPLAAGIYFAPEAHEAYAALGFSPSAASNDGVQMPDGVAYFASRGACLGQVDGHVIAAAFGVFNPAIVVPLVANAWTITDAASILAAREHGARESLRRMLSPSGSGSGTSGDPPEGCARATELLRRGADAARGEGRHLFSGLQSLGFPGDPIADLWRAADLVREHRGDSHIAAWIAHGFDATEISLITEPYIGLPMRTYARSRAWSDAEFDAALERMTARGYFKAGELTQDGLDAREAVEDATDLQETSIVDAIGADFDELCGILEPWADAIREQKGYPSSAGQIVGRRD
jgi:hypothetical protein